MLQIDDSCGEKVILGAQISQTDRRLAAFLCVSVPLWLMNCSENLPQRHRDTEVTFSWRQSSVLFDGGRFDTQRRQRLRRSIAIEFGVHRVGKFHQSFASNKYVCYWVR